MIRFDNDDLNYEKEVNVGDKDILLHIDYTRAGFPILKETIGYCAGEVDTITTETGRRPIALNPKDHFESNRLVPIKKGFYVIRIDFGLDSIYDYNKGILICTIFKIIDLEHHKNFADTEVIFHKIVQFPDMHRFNISKTLDEINPYKKFRAAIRYTLFKRHQWIGGKDPSWSVFKSEISNKYDFLSINKDAHSFEYTNTYRNSIEEKLLVQNGFSTIFEVGDTLSKLVDIKDLFNLMIGLKHYQEFSNRVFKKDFLSKLKVFKEIPLKEGKSPISVFFYNGIYIHQLSDGKPITNKDAIDNLEHYLSFFIEKYGEAAIVITK